MNAGTMMVERAKERSAERSGVAVRVRMSRELHERVERCAAVCRDDVAEWVNKACRKFKAGHFGGVAFDENVIAATRGESVAVWVRQPEKMKGPAVRLACAAACETAERTAMYRAAQEDARMGLPVAGRDYLVEVEE